MSIDFGALAGTVEKDLAAVGQQLHDEFSAELDTLRAQLPGITQAAHQHVDAVASAVISWGEAHLAKLREGFGLPDPATGEPTPAAPSAPAAVDPTQASSSTTEDGSAPSSDASFTTPAETPAA